MRASGNNEPCDEECKFNRTGTCLFGPMRQYGCYLEIGEVGLDKLTSREMVYNNMRTGVMMASMESGDVEEAREELSLIETMRSTQFGFVFKGHDYTICDAARNQGRCPHCGKQSSDGFMWDDANDREAYVGKYSFGSGNIARCFECPKCFEKFFYHDSEM